MNPKEYFIALNRILEYLDARGFDVQLDSNSFGVYMDEQRITCSSRAQGTYLMIISLLHEAGHVIQDRSTFINLRKSKKRDQAIVVEQEYTAWKLGWEIAQELNIDSTILYREYNKAFLTYWTQYIRHLYIEADHPAITQLAETHYAKPRVIRTLDLGL